MKKRVVAIALLALFAGGLLFAKKAKKVDFDKEVQEEEQALEEGKKAKPKKEKKAKKEKPAKEKKQNKQEQSPAQEKPAEAAPAAPAESAAPAAAATPAASEAAATPAATDSATAAPATETPAPAENKKVTAVVKRIGGDVALQDGTVRMETVRESGAVLFYVVNGKKTYPAVKTSEYGQSNYLSIFSGAKEYRLNKFGHCSYSYDVTTSSITETMLVKDIAEVVAVYQLDKYSPKDKDTNCVRVNISIKNLAQKKAVLALKAVYNLCLGENRSAHYSTATNKAIGSEYLMIPSKQDPWIISSDGQNAVEFVLYGKNVTPPKKAVMANKDVIDLSTPITLFNPGNTFHSILSYNDSALALFWDPVEIEKNSIVSYSYAINFSDSDFQNSGKEVLEDASAKPEEVEEQQAAKNLKVTQGKEPLAMPEGSVDPSKLNMEYVQQLINHINSLEQGDPSLNTMKIQQLQTELDEILKVLRSGK